MKGGHLKEWERRVAMGGGIKTRESSFKFFLTAEGVLVVTGKKEATLNHCFSFPKDFKNTIFKVSGCKQAVEANFLKVRKT